MQCCTDYHFPFWLLGSSIGLSFGSCVSGVVGFVFLVLVPLCFGYLSAWFFGLSFGFFGGLGVCFDSVAFVVAVVLHHFWNSLL